MQRSASHSRFDVSHETRRFPWQIVRTMDASSVRDRQNEQSVSPALSRPWRMLIGVVVCVLMRLPISTAADSGNVLLDFTATWCGPCQQMSSTVSKLERQGFPIRKVDIDQEPALASRFNVQSIPCFVLVANGKELDRVTGLTTEQQLRKMLSRLPQPAPEVAQAGEAPRRAGGTGNGGLGLPVTLGELGAADGKRPKIGLPPLFGAKSKDKEPRIAHVDTAEPSVARGQTPGDSGSVANGPVDPLHASVRLRVQDGSGINFGSGTVIDSKPGLAVILTCGHIFRKSGNDSKVEVDVFGSNVKSRPETVNGKVLHFDLDADVGLVTITYPQRLPVARIGSSRGTPAVKDRVCSIGCGGGDKPSREDLTLTALNRYAGPDNIECSGMPQQGRSGGGLFQEGNLIGVCIAADPNEKRGIYAGMKPITQLLEKVGLERLAPMPLAEERALAENSAATKSGGDGEPAPSDRATAAVADELGRFLSGELGAAALTGPPVAPQEYEGAEIICIVRPRTPGTPSRVVIVNQASGRFVGDLLHESQAPAERSTAQRGGIPRPTSSSTGRPVETSLEPQPYRRSRD